MVSLTINNLTVKAEPGMTIYEAASSVGVSIPTLCHLKGLIPSGACRICSVEVDGQKGLVPACSYPVTEGMVVNSDSPRVRRARKTIVELLVENHPQDCLICVRNKNCELQDLAERYGLREHRYSGESKSHAIDISSASIERDPAKCILCGRCVRVCHEIQKIGAIDFTGRGFTSIVTTPYNKGINISDCIFCGQCILVCPTAALREKSSLKEATAALNSRNKYPIVQIAPAVRATLGEEYNFAPGTDVTGKMITALKRLGFKKVFDTNFAADLTIMEEANELISRIRSGKKPLPMFTSCCPGWIRFAEMNYPDLLDNISTCKSPHEMEGAVLKTYYADKMGIDPADIFVVSIMPCTVKKYESARSELSEELMHDVDAVLTTRELVRLFSLAGIKFADLAGESFDNPLGESTGAAAIFGTSGGVMEAALRTACYQLTGNNCEKPEFESVRGSSGIKEASVNIGGFTLNAAVVNGIGNIRPLLDDVRAGRSKYHFIEVMSCPGGCVNGGGQPIHQDPERIIGRMKALYRLDDNAVRRNSHDNLSVKTLYKEYLGEPNSSKAHSILHTKYFNRKKV